MSNTGMIAIYILELGVTYIQAYVYCQEYLNEIFSLILNKIF